MSETVEFPRLTIIDRLSEIPVVDFSLAKAKGFSAWDYLPTKNERLVGYYETVKGLSGLAAASALERSKPYHPAFASAIEKADGYAHKGIDYIQEKNPYIFEAQPDEVADLLRQQREKVIVIARKPLDADFRTETRKQVVEKYGVHVAPRVDTLLDFVESKILSEKPAPTSEAQTQYERALTLSRSVTGTVLAKSTDQLKLLQEKNAYVKKAADSAEALSAITATSFASAKERWSGVPPVLLAEFNKIKELAATLSETLKEKAKERVETLPPPVQAAYKEFVDVVTPLVADLREVYVAEVPWSEKLPEIGRRVNTHATPQIAKLRENVPQLKERFPELLSRSQAAFEAFKSSPAS